MVITRIISIVRKGRNPYYLVEEDGFRRWASKTELEASAAELLADFLSDRRQRQRRESNRRRRRFETNRGLEAVAAQVAGAPPLSPSSSSSSSTIIAFLTGIVASNVVETVVDRIWPRPAEELRDRQKVMDHKLSVLNQAVNFTNLEFIIDDDEDSSD